MLIDCNEVCSWIESEHDIVLFPSQKRFLDGLIHGFDINCPRNFGRTSLTKWYTEYLNEKYANKAFSCNVDMVITAGERAAEDPSYNKFFNAMKECYMRSAAPELVRFQREYLYEPW